MALSSCDRSAGLNSRQRRSWAFHGALICHDRLSIYPIQCRHPRWLQLEVQKKGEVKSTARRKRERGGALLAWWPAFGLRPLRGEMDFLLLQNHQCHQAKIDFFSTTGHIFEGPISFPRQVISLKVPPDEEDPSDVIWASVEVAQMS